MSSSYNISLPYLPVTIQNTRQLPTTEVTTTKEKARVQNMSRYLQGMKEMDLKM